jgi:hypothetical protein
VVNTVTLGDFDGARLDPRYGYAEGTHRKEFESTGLIGHNFAGGRDNFSLFVNYVRRAAQLAEDQPYTATDNLLSLFANDPAYARGRAPVHLSLPPRSATVRPPARRRSTRSASTSSASPRRPCCSAISNCPIPACSTCPAAASHSASRAGKPGDPVAAWPRLLASWATANGLLPAKKAADTAE